jgi:NADPH:quinone reductase
MLKQRGVEVITTVSSARKADHAANAGADHIIDRSEDVAARVQEITRGAGVDRVLEVDLAGNAARYPHVLRPHARVVVYGTSGLESTLPSVALMHRSVALQFFMIYDISGDDRRAALVEIERLLAADALRHTIGLTLRLEDAAAAHEQLEGGQVMGNVVLEIA